MSEIIELIQTHTNYLAIIIFAFIAISIITILVDIVSKKITFLRFIPGIACLSLGIVITAKYLPLVHLKEYIPTLAGGGILIGCGLFSLCLAIVLGIIRSRDKKHRPYIEYEEY